MLWIPGLLSLSKQITNSKKQTRTSSFTVRTYVYCSVFVLIGFSDDEGEVKGITVGAVRRGTLGEAKRKEEEDNEGKWVLERREEDK